MTEINDLNDMPESSKKFDIKLDPDIATAEKIADTDKKLVDYMEKKGEDVAASRIKNLSEKKSDPKNVKSPDPNSFKLLTVDKKILAVLRKIQRDAIDEQDTTIHDPEKSKVYGIKKMSNVFNRDGAGKSGGDGDGGGDNGGMFGGILGAIATGWAFKKIKKITNKFKKVSKPKIEKPKIEKPKIEKPKIEKPKIEKRGAKKVSKLLGKTMKGALRVAKFLGPVGVIISAGMAISDGIDGYENAADSLGIDKDNLTTANKMASAAGSVISGISFGVIDSAEMSKGINNLFGDNKIIEKYSKLGIIEHNTFGNSTILDWKKLMSLKPDEIQKIIDIDDWSDDDAAKLRIIKQSAYAMPEAVKTIKRFDLEDSEHTKIDYKMKTPVKTSAGGPIDLRMDGGNHNGESTNPDDYKTGELFKFYKVKESDFEKLQPSMLSNVKALGAEYLDTYGEKIQINSAYRSVKEQAKLKEQYGNRAAAPGMSMHNYGLAVDMNTKNAQKAIDAKLFDKYGFTRPVPGETWHVEPKNIDRVKIRTQGTKNIAKNDTVQIVKNPPKTQMAETETTPKEDAKKTSEIKTNKIKNDELDHKKVVNDVIVDKTAKERELFQKSAVINKSRSTLQPLHPIQPVQSIQTNAPTAQVATQGINTQQPSILDAFS